jgi:HAE1 family hydrophobic/amphiphilic exporter-1
MVSGMLPSALAFGAGGEGRSPMAIAVIGGLIASTFLSLLFVPAFFAMMSDVGELFSRVFARFLGHKIEPDPALPVHPVQPAGGAPTKVA